MPDNTYGGFLFCGTQLAGFPTCGVDAKPELGMMDVGGNVMGQGGAMANPGKNSTAACLWLLMLTLDADGKRKDVEFSEIQKCLNDLTPTLTDDPGRQPEALMAALNQYYEELDRAGADAVLETVLHQIDDGALRQQVFVMLMRVAISDRQLHRQENSLLRQIGVAWGLRFNN